MNNLNPDNRSKVLGRSAAFSRALRAAKRIAASVTGRQLALAAIVAAASSVAVAAVLTPGSMVSGVIFARASFADPTDIKFKIKGQGQEVINVNNAGDTVMQQIIIAPAATLVGTATRDQWLCW